VELGLFGFLIGFEITSSAWRTRGCVQIGFVWKKITTEITELHGQILSFVVFCGVRGEELFFSPGLLFSKCDIQLCVLYHMFGGLQTLKPQISQISQI